MVRFEPVGPEDELAAAQETDYVNHVFMQQNPGFMILYSFVKDALLSKVGIVKIWWEEREEEERETYYDLTFEPDRLMGYCVAAYFFKLLIFDKVFGLGTTDGLAGFASTTANLIVASYFAKRGFENVARIIKR